MSFHSVNLLTVEARGTKPSIFFHELYEQYEIIYNFYCFLLERKRRNRFGFVLSSLLKCDLPAINSP